jgi:hypothetical protein
VGFVRLSKCRAVHDEPMLDGALPVNAFGAVSAVAPVGRWVACTSSPMRHHDLHFDARGERRSTLQLGSHRTRAACDPWQLFRHRPAAERLRSSSDDGQWLLARECRRRAAVPGTVEQRAQSTVWSEIGRRSPLSLGAATIRIFIRHIQMAWGNTTGFIFRSPDKYGLRELAISQHEVIYLMQLGFCCRHLECRF